MTKQSDSNHFNYILASTSDFCDIFKSGSTLLPFTSKACMRGVGCIHLVCRIKHLFIYQLFVKPTDKKMLRPLTVMVCWLQTLLPWHNLIATDIISLRSWLGIIMVGWTSGILVWNYRIPHCSLQFAGVWKQYVFKKYQPNSVFSSYLILYSIVQEKHGNSQHNVLP